MKYLSADIKWRKGSTPDGNTCGTDIIFTYLDGEQKSFGWENFILDRMCHQWEVVAQMSNIPQYPEKRQYFLKLRKPIFKFFSGSLARSVLLF